MRTMDSRVVVGGCAAVVVLLGLTSVLLLARFDGPHEDARPHISRAAVGPTGPFARALDLYRLTVGSYPKGEDGLKDLIYRPKEKEAAGKWRGPYLEDERSLKDPWGNLYRYRCPGKHNTAGYDLWSAGPDGKDGTNDDITNWADRL